jgi:hypothetical protein
VTVSTYVAVFALVLAYVALVAAYFALRTLAKLRRASAVLGRGLRGERMRESLVEAVNRQAELTAVTREELVELRAAVAAARDEVRDASTAVAAVSDVQVPKIDTDGLLRNVALVRYDAFDGMSGRLSFSLALLDESGDGITISALAGQTDTRVYAKGVAGGKAADQLLSPEEHQAVDAALAKRRGLLARKAG